VGPTRWEMKVSSNALSHTLKSSTTTMEDAARTRPQPRARHRSPVLRRYSTTEPITMASPLPNPRITEEEDCLLCFLASMELAVRVEVEVATVTTSSTVAAVISSALVAASSIA
jgi:hypothetical protein